MMIKIFYTGNRENEANLFKDTVKATHIENTKFQLTFSGLLFERTNKYLILKRRNHYILTTMSAMEYRLLQENKLKALEKLLKNRTILYSKLYFNYDTEQFFSLYKNYDNIFVFYNSNEAHFYFIDNSTQEAKNINRYLQLDKVRVEETINLNLGDLEKVHKIIEIFYKAKYDFVK